MAMVLSTANVANTRPVNKGKKGKKGKHDKEYYKNIACSEPLVVHSPWAGVSIVTQYHARKQFECFEEWCQEMEWDKEPEDVLRDFSVAKAQSYLTWWLDARCSQDESSGDEDDAGSDIQNGNGNGDGDEEDAGSPEALPNEVYNKPAFPTQGVKKLKSAICHWDRLLQNHKQKFGQRMPEAIRTDVRDWLNKVVKKTYNLSEKIAPKPVLSFHDFRKLIKHSWIYDQIVLQHERERVQNHGGLLEATHTAGRPAALAEGAYRRGSNKCLRYGDIEFFIWDDPGRPEVRKNVGARLESVFRKGDESGNKPLPFDQYLLDEGPTCPLTHVLALAFADGVFENITKPSEIVKLEVPYGQSKLKLDIKPEFRDVPVLRAIVRNGSLFEVSKTKPWSTTIMRKRINDLGISMGYEQPLTTYCIRRATGAVLSKNATEFDLVNIMGHVPGGKTYADHYWTQQVDMAALIRGEEPNPIVIDSQTMGAKRNFLAPTGLTQQERDEWIHTLPEVIHAREVQAQCLQAVQEAYGSLAAAPRDSTAFLLHKSAKQHLSNCVRRESDLMLKRKRKEFFEEADRKEVALQLTSERSVKIEPTSVLDENAISLLDKIPERQAIARHFYVERAPLMNDPEGLAHRMKVVDYLAKLCTRRDTRARVRVKSSEDKKRPSAHVLVSSEPLPELDEKRIGRRCIFCIADESLPVSTRFELYSSMFSVRRHLNGAHLSSMVDADFKRCPLPGCAGTEITGDLEPLELFKNHVRDAHGFLINPLLCRKTDQGALDATTQCELCGECHSRVRDDKYQCPVCQKWLGSQDALRKHRKNTPACSDGESHISNLRDDFAQFQCPVCQRSYSSRDALRNHRKKTPACFDKNFVSKRKRQIEGEDVKSTKKIRLKSAELGDYECPACQKTFNDEKSLLRHRRRKVGCIDVSNLYKRKWGVYRSEDEEEDYY